MAVCERCGTECVLPFTCQHCGGKFCPGCRLPPSHDCTGISSWKARPRPAVGMNYGKGGSVTAAGGIPLETRHGPQRRTEPGRPYLKVMAAIIVLVLLGLAWLIMSGYRIG